MQKYTIVLDAMGGDNAPDEVVKGAIMAIEKYPDTKIILSGRRECIEPLMQGVDAERYEILDASEVITMEDAPMLAVRSKKDSSLVKAALAVRDKKAQAMVSAGSTGAILAAGMLRIGRIPGIERPALAPLLPGVNKPFMLIDSGANVDCQPAYLAQFGLMGHVYMSTVGGIKEPRVGLLNIGVEEEKGNKLVKETYQLMKAQTSYAFAGNCEARDVPSGDFDVVVADGFAGNIIVKFTEGLAKGMMSILKRSLMSKTSTKIGAVLCKPAFKELKGMFDYNEAGGAPLLGVDGAVVKAHGSSGAMAICSTIRQAREMVQLDVVGKIKAGLEGLDNSKDNQ